MASSYKHIFLDASSQQFPYTAPSQRPSSELRIPPRNPREHAERLQQQLNQAWETAREKERERTAVSLPVRDGTYLEFEAAPDHILMIKSLENPSSRIRLLNVHGPMTTDGSQTDQEKAPIRATVYVPDGQERYFLNKIQQYAETASNEGNPRNQKLVDSIEHIRLAVVESFWVGPDHLVPVESPRWCEIWLKGEAAEVESSFRDLAQILGIALQNTVLRFPERTIVLGLVNRNHLAQLVESTSDLAELRPAKETARFFLELENRDQTEWIQDLCYRLFVVADPKVAVTILDTGANNGHLLLQPILNDDDCHAFDPIWEVTDHNGHGTLMCGVAAYGDLQACLESNTTIELQHCLESVKILPPRGENDPQLYGDITIQALSRAEIAAPHRQRIVCMAVSAHDGAERGRPSSWSAAVDKIACGYDDDQRRLFVVAAGNIDPAVWSNYNYPQSNLDSSIHDPGQSWNALTVGAYTEKVHLTDSNLADHEVIAAAGGLSPFSTTSTTWDEKRWPCKPDIMLEGGNLIKEPDGFISEHDDLRLISTCHEPTRRQLNHHAMTSAATAQAAWMAAQIQSAYPNAWPETVRGLLVHSAQWTDEMKRLFLSSHNKTEYARLLRVCGYGVPDLDRAINCYQNSLTLIAQEEIQPFETTRVDGVRKHRTREMHLHELPWPRDVLLSLGEVDVTLRITLSYFIEPSPGEVGWENRYRYASHALRFDMNRVSENRAAFVRRINAAARDEEQGSPSSSDPHPWTIGTNGRKLGSIHSDIWTGTAANLATCNMIGVYPIIGWWRERPWLGRVDRSTQYSLIVSIGTPEIGVDIYTPVATMLHIPITV